MAEKRNKKNNETKKNENKKNNVISDAKLNIVEKVIENLEKNNTIWKQGFVGVRGFNYATGQYYRGGNALIIATLGNEYTDPRWMTFKQGSDKKLKLAKGSKATTLLFFGTEMKEISKEEYDRLSDLQAIGKLWGKLHDFGETKFENKNGVMEIKPGYYYEKFVLRYFNVFNGEQWENIEKFVPKNAFDVTNKNLDAFADEIIKIGNKFLPIKESFTLDVPHLELPKRLDGTNGMIIRIPDKKISMSSEERFSTLIHELGHFADWKLKIDKYKNDGMDTPSNLNKLRNYTDDDYARGELVAGLTQMFAFQEYGINSEKAKFADDKHIAYLKSWIGHLRKDPNELFKAAARAETVLDWMKENILDKSLENLKNKENKKDINFEIKKENNKSVERER